MIDNDLTMASMMLKYVVCEINDLDLFNGAIKTLNKSSMRRIVPNVVISIFGTLKSDDKCVRNAVLDSFDWVIHAADGGSNVWPLRYRMETIIFQWEHATADIFDSLSADVRLELEENNMGDRHTRFWWLSRGCCINGRAQEPNQSADWSENDSTGWTFGRTFRRAG